MKILDYIEENIGAVLVVIVIVIMIFSTVSCDAGTGSSNCYIKGNISYNGGEKIYHVPGQEYYDATVPEECFDSEAEARSAGYRKSYR